MIESSQAAQRTLGGCDDPPVHQVPDHELASASNQQPAARMHIELFDNLTWGTSNPWMLE